MQCLVQEEEGGSLKQVKYSITGKDIPVEIMEAEGIMHDFLESGVTDIRREGENCVCLNERQIWCKFRRKLKDVCWRESDGVHFGQR